MRAKAIFLCGFMGSGKSTVGSLLARLLDCEFEDLDETIASSEGLSITDIFQSSGEAGFRKIEGETVQNLDLSGKRVIALGGGTLLNERSRNHILASGLLIYLSAQSDTIAKRLDRSVGLRPLFAGLNPEQRKLKIQDLMAERARIYEMAHIQIVTDGRLPMDVATDIARMITHEQIHRSKRGGEA